MNDYKEPLSPQSSNSDFSQKTTTLTEVEDSLQGSNASLNDKMEFQNALRSAPLIVIRDSKVSKKTYPPDSLNFPTRNTKF